MDTCTAERSGAARKHKAVDTLMLCAMSGAMSGFALGSMIPIPGASLVGAGVGALVGAAAGPMGAKSTSATESKYERRKRLQYWQAHLHDDGQLAL